MDPDRRIVMAPYYGGKNTAQMQDLILPLLEMNPVYLEGFGGSAGILLNRPRVDYETLNDLNHDVFNFWVMLRTFVDRLTEALRYTPFSREEHRRCVEILRKGSRSDMMERARCWYVAVCMSHASLLRNFRGHSKGGNPRQSAGSFKRRVDEQLRPAADRLQGVALTCFDAVKEIEQHNQKDATIYLDPPYVASTRVQPDAYWIDNDGTLHERMLEACLRSKAQIVISCYDSPLYAQRLAKWHRIELEVVCWSSPNKQGERKQRRVEVAYVNRFPRSKSMFIF